MPGSAAGRLARGVGEGCDLRQAFNHEHAYDAILLDLGLPGASGLSFLRGLRAAYETTPVLIVTARHKLSDRITGLDAGADDYVVKPFQIDELCARVRAVVRRTQGRVSPLLTYRNILVDPRDAWSRTTAIAST